MATGLQFARGQLEKTGWKDGSGLGRDESGIKEAIKVKIKNDNKGVGHDPGEEFTFRWWDHAFNKAANNIKVADTDDGVAVAMEADSGPLSRKRPSTQKMLETKSLLYGTFVKSGTVITNGKEEKRSRRDDESSSDSDDDENLDLSSKNTDEDLYKKCGGRTAHKGARHGLRANGKLLRVEQQEQDLLERMRKKLHEQREKESNVKKGGASVEDVMPRKKDSKRKQGSDRESVNCEVSESKKRKKKLKSEDLIQEIVDSEEAEDVDSDICKTKKKKKSKSRTEDLGREIADSEVCDISKRTKKKLKSKTKDFDFEIVHSESEVNCEKKKSKSKKSKSKDLVQETENDIDCDIGKRKKKKSKSKVKDLEHLEVCEKLDCEKTDFSERKKKSKSKVEVLVKGDSETSGKVDSERKRKKKKSKKD